MRFGRVGRSRWAEKLGLEKSQSEVATFGLDFNHSSLFGDQPTVIKTWNPAVAPVWPLEHSWKGLDHTWALSGCDLELVSLFPTPARGNSDTIMFSNVSHLAQKLSLTGQNLLGVEMCQNRGRSESMAQVATCVATSGHGRG